MRTRKLPGVAVVVLVLAACSDSTGPETVAGWYNLVSVDGAPLPWVSHVSLEFRDKSEIAGGHVQLNLDGTCDTGRTSRSTLFSVVTSFTATYPCSWTLDNTAITLFYPGGSQETGSLVDGIISITYFPGTVYVFEKSS